MSMYATAGAVVRASVRSVIIAAVVVFGAMPASADEPSEADKAAASARFNKAVELYKTGDVRAALIEFRRAYKLAPTYHLLFNIGQASAELRDYVGAHRSFTQYLADGGEDIGDERREMVERELVRLAGYLAQLEVTVSAAGEDVSGAEITIDGEVVGTSPMSEAVLVSAGRRQVVVSLEGYARWERYVDLAGEDEKTVEVKLLSLAVDRPPVTVTTGGGRRGLGSGFWASAGVTTALGIGTATLGVLTLRAKSDQDEVLAMVPTTQEAIDDATGRTRRLALYTDIGLGLTTAGAVVTLVLGMRGGGTRPPERQARPLDVIVRPGSVAVSGRF